MSQRRQMRMVGLHIVNTFTDSIDHPGTECRQHTDPRPKPQISNSQLRISKRVCRHRMAVDAIFLL
jgi:hypothetical protein